MTTRDKENRVEKIKRLKRLKKIKFLSLLTVTAVISTILIGVNANDISNLANKIKVASEELITEKNSLPISDVISDFKFEYIVQNVEKGETRDLKVVEVIDGAETTTKYAGVLQYKSEDESVATVDNNGTIQAKEVGHTIITATNPDGLEAICRVNVSTAKSRARVETGMGTAVALKSDGSVWSWGVNTNGVLGTGTTELGVKPKPVLDVDGVTPLKDVIQVDTRWNSDDSASGGSGGTALKSDGTVVTWGRNELGELGNGTNTFSDKAVKVIKQDGTPLENIVEISSQTYSVLALDNKGNVWTWGGNGYGQLGDGTTKNSNVAIKMSKDNINHIVAGYNSSFLFSNEAPNLIYAVGMNNLWQLSSGPKDGIYTKIEEENVKELVATAYATILLKKDGTVWSCGDGRAAGNGTSSTGKSGEFKQVKGVGGEGYLENIVEIGAVYGGYAKDKDGKVYAWGLNNYGQLSVGDTSNRATPVEIKGKNNEDLTNKIEKLPQSSMVCPLAVKKDGTIIGTGNGEHKIFGTSYDKDLLNYEELFKGYLEFEDRQKYIKVGETFNTQIMVNEGFNLYCNKSSINGITYQSSNEDVATVDQQGKVKALKRGETTITATNENGEQARCIISVISNKKEAITLPQVVTSTAGATIVLKEDGTVWTIGYNEYGELANGTTTARYELEQVKISETTYLENVIKITEPSPYYALALTKNGEVYSWGYGLHGSLGLGADKKGTIKYATKVPELKGIIDITTSRYYSTKALTNKGEIYTFGYYSVNQSGDGQGINFTPRKVETINNIVDITAGYTHCIALKGDGTAWTWGSNAYGELGVGTTTGSSYPIQVKSEDGYLRNLVKVEAIDYSTTAIDQEGNGYVWGHNDSSQLGTGNKTNLKLPKKIYEVKQDGPKVIDFGGADSSIAYLLDNGEVYVCGKNDNGQLSQGNTTNVAEFVPAKTEDGNNFEKGLSLSNGADNKTFSVIQENGTLWMAGYNGYGNLITGDTTARHYLTKVGNPTFASKKAEITVRLNETYKLEKDNFWYENEFNLFNETEKEVGTLKYESLNQDIAKVDVDSGLVLGTKEGLAKIEITNTLNGEKAYVLVRVVDGEYTPDVVGGNYHSLAIKNDGSLWGWGKNDYGQLGKTEAKIEKEPIAIIGPDGKNQFKDVKMIAAGYYHSIALTKNGDVYTWGINNYGQLGDGTKVNKNIPTKVDLPEKIIKIAGIMHRTVALSENGNVYVWGRDFTTKPQKLNILSKVIDITGSYILREDKKVYLITNLKKPISGLENVISIENGISSSTSPNHLLALRADGKVYTYGGNSYGQNGQGATGIAGEVKLVKSPDGTGALEDIIQIKSVCYGALAMDSKFNVYYWGYNAHYQSGNNTNRVVNLPYKIEQLENIESVTRTAGYHNMVIDNDGYVWSIGRGTSGELGNGGTVNTKEYGRIGEVYIEPEKTTLTMGIGDQEEVLAKVKNSFNLKRDEVETKLTYRIIDTNIAEVEGTKVIAKQEGRTYLTIESEELGASTTIKIEVLPKGAVAIPDVQAGDDFEVALRADGSVWSWGANTYGQLGNGTTIKSNEPKKIEEMEGSITEISTSDNHTIALTEDGKVYAFGYNGYGQIGNTTTTNASKPVKVVKLENNKYVELNNIVKVKAGKNISFAIDNEFNLWIWGQGYSRYATKFTKLENVIDVTKDYVLTAEGKVYKLSDLEEILTVQRVKALEEGYDHTVMLAEDNTAYAIGANTYGQLGIGNEIDSSENVVGVRDAENIGLLGNIQEIRAGKANTIAITKDNKVYIWGLNENGKSGTKEGTNSNLPVEYTKVQNPSIVEVGNNHTSIANKEGFVFNFGAGENGQLGNRENLDSVEPVMVGTYEIKTDVSSLELREHESKNIGAKVEYFNLITEGEEGLEYTSYNNMIAEVDQQGNVESISVGETSIEIKQEGVDNKLIIPVSVLDANQIAKPDVQTNGSHTNILKANGTVWSYGTNTYGELGNGTNQTIDSPVEVKFNSGVKIVQISTGTEHSIALDKTGTVWTWGRNNYGQLGIKGITSSNVPVQVEIEERIVKIAAGNDFSFAIGQSGKVYAFGYNQNGELGIGTYKNVTVPTQVLNIENAIDIAGGLNHALLVTNKGEVYTTGNNIYGQLANEETRINQFTKVPSTSNITKVEAGDNHSVALSINGDAYVWGSNIYGQLGLSDRTNRNLPTKVEDIRNIKEITAGRANTMLLENTGKIYVTGANAEGELGDGTLDAKDKYSEMTRIPDAIEVTTGNTYSVAIKNNGTVWGWGDYNHGVENKESKTNSEIPVVIGNDSSILNGNEIILKTSETRNLGINTKYQFNVYEEYDKEENDFTYESANNKVAQINDSGIIMGMKVGTTKVTAIDKETKERYTAIVKVIDNQKLVIPKVEGGNGFAIALKGDGTIWTWGYNSSGALGDGTYGTSLVPKKTNIIATYTDISAGKDFGLALRNNGTVWAWGSNSNGQLGMENHQNSEKPLQVHDLQNIEQIATGETHSVALSSYGIIYGWGSNENGELGLSSKDDVVVPKVIATPDTEVVDISAGKGQTVYVTTDGEVYGLGNILNGKLEGLENAIKVEVGEGYILILTQNGEIYEYNGTLLQVAGAKDAIQISAQGKTRMYKNVQEEVFTWGVNTDGQLGTNDTENKQVPTKVEKYGDNSFGIGAGYDDTYIIANDGFVYASGKNNYGQLGNSTQENSVEHTLVGDREFKLVPDNKIMTVNDIEDIEIDSNSFNMFYDNKKDKTQYTWESTQPDVVEVNEEGVLTAKQIGTATIKATDKVTNVTQEAIRVVMPIDEQRLQEISVNGEITKVTGNKTYQVTIKTDEDKADLQITTNDVTDKISIDQGINYTNNGVLNQKIDVTEKVTNIPIRIKTANGTEIDYTLEVIKESKNVNLENLTVNGIKATSRGATQYEAIVEEDVDVLSIVATAQHDLAKVRINGESYQEKEANYENKMDGITQVIPVEVQSEGGIVATYMLTVYKKSALVDIADITVNGKAAIRTSETEYTSVIDRETDLSNVTVNSIYEGATIAIGTNKATVRTAISVVETTKEATKVHILVTARIENETGKEVFTREYVLTIFKARINAKIDILTVNGTTVIPTGNRYETYVASNTDEVDVRVITSLDTDKVKIAQNQEGMHDVTNTVATTEDENIYTILVTDGETGVEQEYELVIRKPSSDTSIKSIVGESEEYEKEAKVVKNPDDVNDNSVYELKVPKEMKEITLKVTTNSKTARISINGGKFQDGGEVNELINIQDLPQIPVIIEAENGTQKEYTVNIVGMSDDTTLKELTVNGNQVEKSDIEENTYNFTLTENLDEVTVRAITTNAEASLYIENGDFNIQEVEKTVTMDSKVVKVKIVVKAETGKEETYFLNIHGIPDNTNATITVDGEEGTFVAQENKYIFRVDGKLTNHNILVETEDEKAKIKIADQAETIGTATMQVTNDAIGQSYQVVITAQDGTKEIVTIELQEKETDAEIAYLTVNNEILVQDNNGNYSIELKHDVDIADIFVKLNSDYATVALEGIPEQVDDIQGLGELEYKLKLEQEGEITLSVKVTAEDGTLKTHNLTITKQNGNTNLASIMVDGNTVIPNEEGEYEYVIARKDTASVVATTENEKASVKIAEGEAVINKATQTVTLTDETTMVEITVIAEDGTEEIRQLQIRKIANDNSIEKITAEGIDEKNIIATGENTFEIKAPISMQKINVTVTSRSDYASLKLNGEEDTAYDIKEMTREIDIPEKQIDITVVVKAENGSVKNYTITIVKINSLDIENVLLDSKQLEINEQERTYKGLYNADGNANLQISTIDKTTKIELIKDNQTIKTSTGDLDIDLNNLDGEVNLKFKVTLQDDSDYKMYNITLNKKSTDNSIEYVGIDDAEIEQVDGGYEKILDRKDTYTLNIKATNEYAKIKLDNGEYVQGKLSTNLNMSNIEEKEHIITVQSQNGEEKTYPLHIRKISNDTSLKIVTVNSENAELVEENYHAFVERTIKDANVKVEGTSKYANVEILLPDEIQIPIEKKVSRETTVNSSIAEREITLTEDRTEVIIKVTAENGEEKTYTLEIEKESQDASIAEIKVDNVLAELKDGVYKASVLDTLENTNVYVKTTNPYASIKINNNENVAIGENIIVVPLEQDKKIQNFEVEVTAQDGTVKTYTLEITRLNADNTLEYVKVNNVEVSSTNENLYESIIDSTSSKAQIEIKANNENTEIVYVGTDEKKAKGILTLEVPTIDEVTEHTFKAIAENGEEKTYTVRITKKSNDNSIMQILVNNQEAIKTEDGNYTIDVLDTVNTANIRVTTTNEKATVKINSEEVAVHIANTSLALEEKVTVVTITTTSETGIQAKATLTITKKSDNYNVQIITVDEKEVTDYNERTHTYTAIADVQKNGYNVTIMAQNAEATISLNEEIAKGMLRTFIPIEGSGKEVTFTVTSEHGEKQDYTLVIIKASDNIRLEQVKLNDVEIQPENEEEGIYREIIPKLATSVNVRVKAEDEYAKVKIGDAEANYGESTISIPLDLEDEEITIPVVVTAADGKTVKTYNIMLVRGNNNTDITQVQVEKENIPFENGKYSAVVKGGLEEAKVTITLADKNASVELSGETKKGSLTVNVPLDGIQTIKEITVIAEDGTIKKYVLEINKHVSIEGKVITENTEDTHTAFVSIYKTSDKRKIDDKVNPREVIASAITNEDGTFDIMVPEVDNYDVVITKPGYLNYTVTEIATKEGESSNIGDRELIAGDVEKTGQIEVDDLVKIVDNYGTVQKIDGEINTQEGTKQLKDIIRNAVIEGKTAEEIIQEINEKTENKTTVTLEQIKAYAKQIIYDLNEDGIIDNKDKTIVTKNYDKLDVVEKWVNPVVVQNSVLSGDNTLKSNNKERSTQKPNSKGFIKPMDTAYEITSNYGYRIHPITGKESKHTGIDISGVHHTNIYAVANGEVTYAGVQNGFGNCIEIKHKLADGSIIYSFYAHLSKINVEVGDKILVGEKIGIEGGDPETDENAGSSTGHHLHFEMRNKSGYGNDIDPKDYIEF